MHELDKLRQMLDVANIPYINDGDDITNIDRVKYPSKDFVCSVIYGQWTIGYDSGLLEIMGLTDTGDVVEGYLSADEVFARILDHFNSTKKET